MTIQQALLSSNTAGWLASSTSPNSNGYTLGTCIDSSGNIYTTNSNYSIIKRNSAGAFQWVSGLSAGSNGSLAIDSAGNLYVTGEETVTYGASFPSLYLAKFNSSGVFQWGRTFGGTSYLRGYRVFVDASDNVYVTGTNSSGVTATWLVKFNTSGTVQWQKRLVDTSGNGGTTFVVSIGVDSSGNVYIAGSSQDNASGFLSAYSAVLAKYNSSGTLQWKKNLYGGGGNSASFSAITIDRNDNIYALGAYMSPMLVKYDTSGTVQWQKQFLASSPGSFFINTVQIDTDVNGSVYFGTSYGGLLAVDSSGSLLWANYFKNTSGTVFKDTQATKVISASNLLVTSGINTGTSTYFVGNVLTNGTKLGSGYTLGSNTIDYLSGTNSGSITVSSLSLTAGTTPITDQTPTASATALDLSTTFTTPTNNVTNI